MDEKTEITAGTEGSNTSQAAEPRIIEEHIVAPPPKVVPLPVSTPSVPAPLSPQAAPPEIVPKAASALPIPPPAQPTPANASADALRILEGVKLPERPSTPEPQRNYDTSLTGSELSVEEKATRETRVREAARAVNESLPTTAPKNSDTIRRLHTLKEDLQSVVRTKKISLVRAVALEEEKRHRPNILNEQATRARRAPSFTVVLTLFLFLLGAGALGGMYFIVQDRAAPVAVPSQMLFAEQAVPFPISTLAPADVRREIASARGAGSLTLGSILQIVPMVETVQGSGAQQAPATFGQFLSAIGAKAPEELSRAAGNEFFFGFHAVDENAPVIVATISSYERAFAAMLEWERTLNADLTPIFTLIPMQTIGPGGTLVERTFRDDIIRNYDVRALKDDGGQIQLYYSFPTRNILIIAESPYSFAELLSRLRADRRL